MTNAELFFYNRVEARRALELERWGGVLAVCALSGSVRVERVESLRVDDGFTDRDIPEGHAFVVFGPGRLVLESGEVGAEILALGTSDAPLVASIPPNAPGACLVALDFIAVNRLRRLAERVHARAHLARLSAHYERVSCIADICETALSGGIDPSAKAMDYVTLTVEAFKKNLDSKARLPDVAWRLGITEEYLVKLFRARLGVTPMRYFRELKLAEAERLLSEGKLSVKEISWKLGFVSQQHFTRAFKAARGRNPGEVRSAARRGVDAAAVDDLRKEVNPSPHPGGPGA